MEQLHTPALEEAGQQLQEEDDGNVEVSLDDSQSDEWSLEKEVDGDGESDSQEKVEEEEEEVVVEEVEKEEKVEEKMEEKEEEEDQDHYRKTSPELDTAAAITNILSEIVGGESNDSRAVVGR